MHSYHTSRGPSFNRFWFFGMDAPGQPHLFLPFFSLSLCPVIFVPLPFFEYVVHFPLPDGVFLPCDHGLYF